MAVFTDSATVNTVGAVVTAAPLVLAVGRATVNTVAVVVKATPLVLCVGINTGLTTVATVVTAAPSAKLSGIATVNSVAAVVTAAPLVKIVGRATVNSVANIGTAAPVLRIIGKSAPVTVATYSAVGVCKVRMASTTVSTVATASGAGVSQKLATATINGVTVIMRAVGRNMVITPTKTVNAVAAVVTATPLLNATGRATVNSVWTSSATPVVNVIGKATVASVTTVSNVTNSVKGSATVNSVSTVTATGRTVIKAAANVHGSTYVLVAMGKVLDRFGKFVPPPTWYDRYWAATVNVIQAAWPEVAGKIAQDNSIQRRDWVNELNSGKLSVPSCVVKLDITPTTEYGLGPRYLIAATVYYFTSIQFAQTQPTTAPPTVNGTNITTASFITDKLVTLQNALYADATMGTNQDDIPMDASAENLMNASVLSAKNPYQAGSLTVTTLVSGVA